jgi:hypothetical protein
MKVNGDTPFAHVFIGQQVAINAFTIAYNAAPTPAGGDGNISPVVSRNGNAPCKS